MTADPRDAIITRLQREIAAIRLPQAIRPEHPYHQLLAGLRGAPLDDLTARELIAAYHHAIVNNTHTYPNPETP